MNDEWIKTTEEVLYLLVVFLWGLLAMCTFSAPLYLLIAYLITHLLFWVFYTVRKIKIWKMNKKRKDILDGKRGPDYGKIDR